jgi:hypothetical protein
MNNQKGDFNYELLKYKVGVDPIAQNYRVRPENVYNPEIL